MDLFSDLDEQITALRSLVGECAELSDALNALSDDGLVEALESAAEIARSAERIGVVGAGIVAARSTREAGHTGLAQSRGHRKASEMIQRITGGSRADAVQRIRVGQAVRAGTTSAGPIGESDAGASGGEPTDLRGTGPGDADPRRVGPDRTARACAPWHAPLGAALVAARISSAQYDAILRGLGEPPHARDIAAITDATVDSGFTDGGNARRSIDDERFTTSDDDELWAQLDAEFRAAWSAAADQLADEAAHRTVEELRSEARTIRDQLDPDGAERRFLERYEMRSYRMWTDADGRHHGSFTYDDEGYALIRTIHDSALRPRRGGPRFVDEEERRDATALADDPRTNDQLAYDLMLDLVRAGALADAKTVHGTRQAGVRVVRVVTDGPSATAHTEDGLVALPPASVDQKICDTSEIPVTVDRRGNPLNVGREHRLFTPAQRIALAIRDGGCRWRGCDRPASYCEAHHIDPYADGGSTDIDRGMLLCRFHHMQLHHGGWLITREDGDDFVLHDPGGDAFALERRLALTYAFSGIDRARRRYRRAA